MKTKNILTRIVVVTALMSPGLSLYAADDHTSKETVGEKTDDAVITSKVKMQLMNHRDTSALRTKVETNNGVVTLTGTARNSAEKELSTELARKVQGVKRVDNQMVVDTLR